MFPLANPLSLLLLHFSPRLANAIVRSCVSQDPEGNGWVLKPVFLAAVEAAGVTLTAADAENALEAMKGGRNRQGDSEEFAEKFVRYSGMVHRFDTFLQNNTGDLSSIPRNSAFKSAEPGGGEGLAAGRSQLAAGQSPRGIRHDLGDPVLSPLQRKQLDSTRREGPRDGGRPRDGGGGGGGDNVAWKDGDDDEHGDAEHGDADPAESETSSRRRPNMDRMDRMDHMDRMDRPFNKGTRNPNGVDQFEYLKINAPSPPTITPRTSLTTGPSVLSTPLWDWNPPPRPAKAAFDLAEVEPTVADVCSAIHMGRTDVAMCFRQFDGDAKGALGAEELGRMLQSSKLKKLGLAKLDRLAGEVCEAIFSAAGKTSKRGSGCRVDFNEIMLAVSGVLKAREEEAREARDAETIQPGTAQYGENRNAKRPPQSFGEHQNSVANPAAGGAARPQRKAAFGYEGENGGARVAFARSALMEESIANAVLNSRTLTVEDGGDFGSAAVKIRHAFLAHNRRYAVENGGDSELSVRSNDVGKVLYEVGVNLNKGQLVYLLKSVVGVNGGGGGGGAEEDLSGDGDGGDYVSCRGLVLYLANLCGFAR